MGGLLGRRELEDIATGSTLLASGGGGSVTIPKQFIDEILSGPYPAKLVDGHEVKDSANIAMVACIGSPNASRGGGLFGGAYLKACNLLEEAVGEKFSHTCSCEIGPNIFVALLTAVKKGLCLIDGDGAGRSVPTLDALTYAHAGLDSTFAVANQGNAAHEPEGLAAVLVAKTAKDIEGLVRPLISTPNEFDSVAGMAGWAMRGEQLKREENSPQIRGTITYARKVGEVLRAARESGKDPIEALRTFFKDRFFLLSGQKVVLTSGGETTSGGFDNGVRTFSIGKTERYHVNIKNENMIIWDAQKCHPIAMAPDLICYLTPEGYTVSNADLKINDEVYLIGLKAEARLRREPLLGAFMNVVKATGYLGPYVPIEELNQ